MAKVIKAKVIKAKVKRRKKTSKGAGCPWQIWTVDDAGYHHWEDEHETEKKAQDFIAAYPEFARPVIVHIDIPPMEY